MQHSLLLLKLEGDCLKSKSRCGPRLGISFQFATSKLALLHSSRMSAVAPPTRRELTIITLLLVFLLLVFRSHDQPSPSHISQGVNNSSDTNPSLSYNGARQALRTRLTWRTSPVPQTKVLAHVPGQSFLRMLAARLIFQISTGAFTGWSIFDRLYIFKGVVYIVTDEPSKFPNVSDIYSKGLFIENGEEEVASRLPTDEDITIISTRRAKQLFGTEAFIMDGVTVCCICILLI